eukprot:TRINITY_DN11430_c0_g1_i3.p1 TRINITY_DN11430_c0_g1~~TRINITY_DN11430_c0_g1_i3.p1  ORF type:complete len:270 (+),score=72.18 TRINITY_DN11430_c0_g1_i3:215-1024(+)
MTCSDRFAFLYECWCDEELDVWYSESEGEEEPRDEEIADITSPLIYQRKNSNQNNTVDAGGGVGGESIYGDEMMLAQPPSNNNSTSVVPLQTLPNQPQSGGGVGGGNSTNLHATSVNSFSTTSLTGPNFASHPPGIGSPNSAPIQDLSVTSGSGIVSGYGGGVAPPVPTTNGGGKQQHRGGTTTTTSSQRRGGAAGSVVDPLQASAALYGEGDNNYDDDMDDEEYDDDEEDAFYPPLILHEPMPWKIRGRGVVRIRYVSVTVPEEPLLD